MGDQLNSTKGTLPFNHNRDCVVSIPHGSNCAGRSPLIWLRLLASFVTTLTSFFTRLLSRGMAPPGRLHIVTNNQSRPAVLCRLTLLDGDPPDLVVIGDESPSSFATLWPPKSTLKSVKDMFKEIVDVVDVEPFR